MQQNFKWRIDGGKEAKVWVDRWHDDVLVQDLKKWSAVESGRSSIEHDGSIVMAKGLVERGENILSNLNIKISKDYFG